ncbi:MAG TPA: fibronectin type III domain-containing protein [Actinomycetes bacterium]
MTATDPPKVPAPRTPTVEVAAAPGPALETGTRPLEATLPLEPTRPLAPVPAPSAARRGRRRWAVPLIAIGAALALIVGLVVWAPWANEAPARPTGLKAGAATVSSIVLRWAPPATSPVPDRYVILRGGAEVGSVPGTVTAYKDTGLAPATTYQYTVVAQEGDQRSAPSATLAAKTLTPAVSAARLAGTWDVNTRVAKAPSGSDFTLGEKAVESWTFTPRCEAGPCAVVVSGILWGHPFTATLTRAGAVYTGSTPAHITHCGPVAAKDVQNTLKLRMTVKTAGLEGGAWAASSWVGSLVLSSPYTSAGMYYCPVQSVTASLAASR